MRMKSLPSPPMNPRDNDPFGNAVKAHLAGRTDLVVNVYSDIAEDDIIPAPYLFRSFDEMPEVEQAALEHCRGTVLDVGAGAGPHTLWLQQKGLEVTALDISLGCTEAMRAQRITKVVQGDVYLHHDEKYDTLLMLMNGIGISATLEGLDDFLTYVPNLLNSGGQVLVDSSDLIYLFEDEKPEDHYYGEVQYQMEFEGALSEWFGWLFIDFPRLNEAAEAHGFKCEKLLQGPSHDFLARLTLK
jgi:SAM-dependent methyltransferase